MIKKFMTLFLLFAFSFMVIACENPYITTESPATTNQNPVTTTQAIGAPVTLTVYSQLANYSGQMTGWFAQIMLEEFNVILNIIPDSEGVYETRMEAQNLGDIVVWGSDGEDYLNAVDAGLLFDWEEDDLLEEYGPYIYENMQPALEKNRGLSGTGNVYGFGHNVAFSSEDHEAFFYTWDLRWDLYDQLGRPVVNDLDDFFDLMVAMKALSPTDETGDPTYAVSLWPDWDGSMVMYVKSMATAYYGHDELGVGLYDVETGEYYDALDPSGPYVEMLRFFNKLYRNNLLDPDSMTQTFDDMTAKVINGGTFFSIFNFGGSIAYNTNTHIAENKLMLSMVPLDATPIVYGMNVLGGNRVWSIGAKTQYPELCMEILNWLSTPMGRMTSEYGPYGVTWYYDDDGNTVATDLGIAMHYDNRTVFPAESGYSGNFGDGDFEINNTTWSLNAMNPDSNGERFGWDFWRSNQTDPLNALEAAWRLHTGTISTQEYLDSIPYRVALGTSYSESRRSDALKVKWEQVTKTIVDYSWQAIYAKSDGEFNFILNTMTSRANNYGYADCVAWSENEAATRFALEEAVRNAVAG